MKKILFILSIFAIINIRSAERAAAQQAQPVEVSQNETIKQILDQHYKSNENNQSLKKLIKDIRNKITQKICNQNYSPALMAHVSHQIYDELKIAIRYYRNLPKELYDFNYLRDFISELVKRYSNKILRKISIEKFDELPKVLKQLVLKNLSLWKELIGISTYTFNRKIHPCAISPDGKYIVTVDNNKTEIIEISTGKSIHNFNNIPSGAIFVFSPDSKFLAIRFENTFSLIQVGTCNISHSNFDSPIRSLSFSPDGTLLVAGDGISKLINAYIGKIRKINHPNWTAINFNFNGEYLILQKNAVEGPKRIRIININNGETIYNDNEYTHTVFSPDGKFLAFGKNGAFVKVVEIATGTIKFKAQEHDFPNELSVNSVIISPDSKLLATVLSYHASSKVFNSERRLITTEDGDRFVEDYVIADYRFVKIYEIATGKIIFATNKYVERNDNVTSIEFSPDSKLLIIRYNKNNVLFIEISTGKAIPNINIDFSKPILFSSDSKFLVCGSKIVFLYNYFKGLKFEQLNLLKELSSAKKAAKNTVITIDKKDKDIFYSLPKLLQDALKQNLRFSNLNEAERKADREYDGRAAAV